MQRRASDLAQELGTNAIGFEADVTNEDDVDRVIQETLDKFGKITGVFTSAGIIRPLESFLDTSLDNMMKVFRVNTLGVFLLIKKVVKKLLERNEDELAIVCMSSIASVRADIAPICYSVSKAGVNALVIAIQDALLEDERTKRMRINSVVPAGVLTPMSMRVAEKLNEKRQYVNFDYEKFDHSEPEDLAKIVAFLLSKDSSRIKGQNYICDGGLINQTGLRLKTKPPRKNKNKAIALSADGTVKL